MVDLREVPAGATPPVQVQNVVHDFHMIGEVVRHAEEEGAVVNTPGIQVIYGQPGNVEIDVGELNQSIQDARKQFADLDAKVDAYERGDSDVFKKLLRENALLKTRNKALESALERLRTDIGKAPTYPLDLPKW